MANRMDKGTIEHRVFSVFIDVFKISKSELSNGLQRMDIQDWDSLGHIQLIVAIEKEFKIKIPWDKAAELRDIKDIIEYIKNTE
jgi:acyl carrier protein